MKRNHLGWLTAGMWFAVAALAAVCYAAEETEAEPDDPGIETVADPDQESDTPPEDADVEVAADPDETPDTEAADSIDAYSEIVDRPLFSETRRPPAPIDESAVGATNPVPTAAPTGDVQLLGVVITPEMQGAMLKAAGDKKATLRALGDEVNGWQVAAVEPRRVRLTQGPLEKVVELERKAAPQPKPREPQATRGQTRAAVPTAAAATAARARRAAAANRRSNAAAMDQAAADTP